MNEFLNSGLFDWLWKVVCIIIAVGVFAELIRSAKKSLEKPGNKIWSLTDEVIIGIITLSITSYILMTPFSTIMSIIMIIIKWLVDTVLIPLLRLIGLSF